MDDRRDLTLQLDRPPARVDEPLIVEWVGELERRIGERGSEGIPEAARVRRVSELDDETHQRGARPSRLYPGPDDSESERAERCSFSEPESSIERVPGEVAKVDAVGEIRGDEAEVRAPG